MHNNFFLILNQYKKLGVRKKSRKQKKTEKTEPWKKPIKILKKPAGLVLVLVL
jgi:hypothetical protein